MLKLWGDEIQRKLPQLLFHLNSSESASKCKTPFNKQPPHLLALPQESKQAVLVQPEKCVTSERKKDFFFVVGDEDEAAGKSIKHEIMNEWYKARKAQPSPSQMSHRSTCNIL